MCLVVILMKEKNAVPILGFFPCVKFSSEKLRYVVELQLPQWDSSLFWLKFKQIYPVIAIYSLPGNAVVGGLIGV